jgi:hypothetical protein
MVAASFGVAFFVAVAQATAHVPGHLTSEPHRWDVDVDYRGLRLGCGL